MSDNRITQARRDEAAAYVRRVIFAPWRSGAQGPDAFDCWGLARDAQRALAGRDLPLINADPEDLRKVVRLIAEHPLRADWIEAERPDHLDLVMMSHSRDPHHIGTWLEIDGGGILHATEQFGVRAAGKPGVSFDSLAALKMQGWMRLQFMHPRAGAAP